LPTNTQSNAIVERPTNRPPTITPQPPTATIIQPTAIPSCTPRADWPTYIVVAGDTLGRVAVRAGTSTTALMQANCLSNANLISVGQALRVPRQPTPPTAKPPTVVPTVPVQQIGTIKVSPFNSGDPNNLILNAGTTVTVIWDGGPSDAIRTDFFQRDLNGVMTLFNSDNNTADGLRVTWNALANFKGTLTASAIRADGSHIEPIFTPFIEVLDPNAPGNTITLNTYLRIEGSIYFVKPGQPTILTWAAAPKTATRVDFTFTPADHTKQPYSLGSDSNNQDGIAIAVTFTLGDVGVISAQAFNGNSVITDAKAVTINAGMAQPPAETTAEATAEATP